MKQTVFEQMNGTYTQQGDYLILNLTVSLEEEKPIGIWGERVQVALKTANRPSRETRKRHLRYLKQNRKVLYYNLLTSGKLNDHLADIDKQADDMFYRLVKELAEKENVTERLKSTDQMLWVQKMNNIRNRATEIILNDIVHF